MAASQTNISSTTLMGANLILGGATFRVWAPNAIKVYVIFDFSVQPIPEPADQSLLLLKDFNTGHWTGFIAGITDRQEYMFYVVGASSTGPKRDPYARELATPFPGTCYIRDPALFPWHETGYQTPQFGDFVIYQLHVGVFYAPRLPLLGTFLDVAAKIPYLSELGITVIQLLPIQEYVTQFSMGYNNQDFYSPEMYFGVAEADLAPYLLAVNELLITKNQQPYQLADLKGEMNQLKVFIDLCHIYGLGVIFDQVFNHAGGGFDDDDSLYFMDRQNADTNDNSLYFTSTGYSGGLVFDYTKPEVRDFLINNCKYFIEEYKVDGFRFDQVSAIDQSGKPDGWMFCQHLTSTLKFGYPSKINHAEYWPFQNQTVTDPPVGIGFNTTLSDSPRQALRSVISGASWPGDGPLDMAGLGQNLWPSGYEMEWQFVQGPENQDVVYIDHCDRQPRMTALCDPSNSRSWYATSRSRVSTGVIMTSPGIPMLFMGQEFLEDKYWSENFDFHPNQFIYWDGLNNQKQMSDFYRYTKDLINMRWQLPALRSQGFSVSHTNDQGRVIAYHRWVPGEGKDVMVVIYLGNSNNFNYRIGFPIAGSWKESFNSDFYENCPNPNTIGNGGWINTENQPYDNLNFSASITLPANSMIIFSI